MIEMHSLVRHITVLLLFSIACPAEAIPDQASGFRIEVAIAPDCTIGLRWIAPGTFIMGSPNTEPWRNDNESTCEVSITHGFYLAETELTQDQWLRIVSTNPSFHRGGRLPVESITWDMAMDFCRRLNETQGPEKTRPSGFRWDLPTEAQWEFACRAGCVKPLNHDMILTSPDGWCDHLDKVAWYRENTRGKTRFVAGKSPNKWGLFDMHGNVWEWCRDNYQSRHPGGKDPLVTGGGLHVRRGGSAGYPAHNCRAASRDGLEFPAKGNGLGMRLALVITRAPVIPR